MLETTTSFWHRFDPEARDARAQATTALPRSCDVAIIGAGFAGLSAAGALRSADPGLHVVVLEAAHVGFGASGRNAGGVLPLAVPSWALRGSLPDAERTWALGALAQQVAGLIAGFLADGECEAKAVDFLLAGTSRSSAALLGSAAKQVNAEGLARFVSEHELRARSPVRARGALVVSGATINPYRHAQALAGRLGARGVSIHERCPVARLERQEHGWMIWARDGQRLHARKVVLATNAYTSRLGVDGVAPVKPAAKVVRTYMLASGPLQRDALDAVVAEGDCVASATSATYVRRHHDRIFVGGLDVRGGVEDPDPSGLRALAAELARDASKLVPALAGVSFECVWGGAYHAGPGEMPIVRPWPGAEGLFLNVGYASGGVALALLSGPMVAGLVLGNTADTDVERLRAAYQRTRFPLAGAVRAAWGALSMPFSR